MRINLRFVLSSLFQIFLLFIFSPSIVNADTCPNPSDDPCWVAKAPMPTARRDMGVAADASGKIYAVGGFDGSGFVDVLEVYDPVTDTWTIKSPVPTARNDMGFAYNPSNGKFYLGGGFNGISILGDFYEYDPVFGVWTAKAPMPTASIGLRFAAGQNGRIYSIGGGFLDGTYVNNVEEYDPDKNEWNIKSAIPSPRSDAGLVAASNGKIYLIGGGGIKNNIIGFLEDVNEYDPATDSWNTRSPMSIKRHGVGASLNAEGKIYVVGGSNVNGYTQLVEEYDTSTNSWTVKTSFPAAIFALGQALGGDGKAYVIGGQTLTDQAVNTNYAGFVPSPTFDLNVPLLKQTSNPWQSHEYDSATLWNPANPTIKAWGCALTSAAMVFQYHGITKLPDNSNLDPGTLNSWLKNQSDGYVRNGLVNWLALSRLSKLAKPNNPAFSYDALEYRRINGEDKPKLTEDLQNGIPGILEEPGHFIVGKGISGATFLINDPFYARSNLSDYSNTFLSLGRYVPSNTDLSYIMLVVNEGIDVSVTDTSGNPVGESFVQPPLVNDQNSEEDSGDPLNIIYFPKPENGEYKINLSAGSETGYTLEIYMYDQNGNVKKIIFEGIASPGNTDNYSINFNKDATFDTLISDIKFLRSTRDIKDFNTYMSLLAKARVAKNIRKIKPAVRAVLKSIQKEIEKQRGKGLTENAYQILSTDANLLLSAL